MTTLRFDGQIYELGADESVDRVRLAVQDALERGGGWVDVEIDGGQLSLLVSDGVPVTLDRRHAAHPAFSGGPRPVR